MHWNLPKWSLACAAILLSGWAWQELQSTLIEPARSAARRTPCKNEFFQHSGSHPLDSVVIDVEGKVKWVWSCPVCSDDSARVLYLNEKGDPLNEANLPLLTFLEAKRLLAVRKSSPRYRQLRETFNRQVPSSP